MFSIRYRDQFYIPLWNELFDPTLYRENNPPPEVIIDPRVPRIINDPYQLPRIISTASVRTRSRQLPEDHPHQQARTTAAAEELYGNLELQRPRPQPQPRQRTQQRQSQPQSTQVAEQQQIQQVVVGVHGQGNSSIGGNNQSGQVHVHRNNKRSRGEMELVDNLDILSNIENPIATVSTQEVSSFIVQPVIYSNDSTSTPQQAETVGTVEILSNVTPNNDNRSATSTTTSVPLDGMNLFVLKVKYH